MLKLFLLLVCACHNLTAGAQGCVETEKCKSSLKKCLEFSNGLDRFNCESDVCAKKCKICELCNDGEKYAVAAPMSEREKCLEEHNKLRRLHKDTPDIVWDEELASIAQQYAEYLVEQVDFRHSSVGENMYMKINSPEDSFDSCLDATQAWYNEIQDFDFKLHKSVDKNKETRHFEQVNWKANHKAGFGIARHAKSKTLYVIGRYEIPPMSGQEMENLEPLKGN